MKRPPASTPLKVVPDDPSNCRISDNLADSCKTLCKICGEAFFLTAMRSHTLMKHRIQITRYKQIHGSFEIIEKVFHKCYLCGKLVLLDSDSLGGHIKGTHKMKEKAYKEEYCNYAVASVKPKVQCEEVKKKVGLKKRKIITGSGIKSTKKRIKSFNPFTDIEYDCNLKHCDQCERKSAVIQIIKMEKSCVDNIEKVEEANIGKIEEALLSEWSDVSEGKLLEEVVSSCTEETSDQNDFIEELSVKETDSSQGPLYTKSMSLALDSFLEQKLLRRGLETSFSSDFESSLDISCETQSSQTNGVLSSQWSEDEWPLERLEEQVEVVDVEEQEVEVAEGEVGVEEMNDEVEVMEEEVEQVIKEDRDLQDEHEQVEEDEQDERENKGEEDQEVDEEKEEETKEEEEEETKEGEKQVDKSYCEIIDDLDSLLADI